MIRRVAFYWILLTLMLVDSWLLSKPNILGKIGLIIYKYHYLRSFPRTLLTVWIVVSISVMIVLVVQFLLKQEKLLKPIAMAILGGCLAATVLMMAKVYSDFTLWTYSHTGLKFRYGAYLLPIILMIVFANGLFGIHRIANRDEYFDDLTEEELLQMRKPSDAISHDTSRP